ncbi:MAG: hypothetical protein O2795_09755 [Acidobacteria bacterium]|nr:hypothetical protein [Acidobacteriota bacterium]
MAVSDAAVLAKTGKTWVQWFSQLDQAGALEWDHKTIARHLADSYPLGGWWSQMIAVTYEQARGLRDKHEQKDGYQIQRERTMAVPVEKAWEACKSLQWLPEAKKSQIRSIREDKRLLLRLNWPDGGDVLIGANAKGDGKCAVGVQQSKLPDRESAEQAKQFWARRLDELRERLEGD